MLHRRNPDTWSAGADIRTRSRAIDASIRAGLPLIVSARPLPSPARALYDAETRRDTVPVASPRAGFHGDRCRRIAPALD